MIDGILYKVFDLYFLDFVRGSKIVYDHFKIPYINKTNKTMSIGIYADGMRD